MRDGGDYLDKAWRYYHHENASMTHHTLSYKSSYTSFILSQENDISVNKFGYCCFVIHMEKNTSTLEILLAAPLETIKSK